MLQSRVVTCAVLVLGVLALAAGPAAAGAGEPIRIAGQVNGLPAVAATYVSQEAFFDDGSARAVVLGRADNFADNLGGASLAGVAGGPLLLSPSNELDGFAAAEIDRVLPDRGQDCSSFDAETEVYLLGGEGALSTAVESEVQGMGFCTQRLAGPTRVETAIAVAQVVEALAVNLGIRTSNDYLLARSDNPVDSSAGGAIGARFGQPILVTQGTELHPAVRNFLFPAGDIPPADNVTILGGTAALSQNVEDQVNAAGDANVRRLAGASREDTAAAIAGEYIALEGLALDESLDTVSLVNGFQDDSWVLALTAGAVSPLTSGPVLYVRTDDLTQATVDVLFAWTPALVLGYGNTDLISDQTLADADRVSQGPVD